MNTTKRLNARLAILTLIIITLTSGCIKQSSTRKATPTRPKKSIRKISLDKYIPSKAIEDKKIIYSDLDQDGMEEAVIAYENNNSIGYVKAIGWNGSLLKELWTSKANQDVSALEDLKSEDINKSGSKEVLTYWAKGAHSMELQIDAYKKKKYKSLGRFSSTHVVDVIDHDSDGIKEVELNERAYDEGVSPEFDSTNITLYKWNGKKYKLWKKSRQKTT